MTPKCPEKRVCGGDRERAPAAAAVVEARLRPGAFGARPSPGPVLLRCKGAAATGFGGESPNTVRSGEDDLLVGGAAGTERILVKDLNRGRMYESVEGGGAGGGVGGVGGGNQLCKESRARSVVTMRCSYKSAFDPTIYMIKSGSQFFWSSTAEVLARGMKIFDREHAYPAASLVCPRKWMGS